MHKSYVCTAGAWILFHYGCYIGIIILFLSFFCSPWLYILRMLCTYVVVGYRWMHVVMHERRDKNICGVGLVAIRSMAADCP